MIADDDIATDGAIDRRGVDLCEVVVVVGIDEHHGEYTVVRGFGVIRGISPDNGRERG